MGSILQEVEQSEKLLIAAKRGQETCFLCRYIVEDLEKNKKLTGHPKDWSGGGLFPVEGKLRHLILELGEVTPEDEDSSPEDLASIVDRILENFDPS